MLVLTRKLRDQIVIGDNVRITVSRLAGNRVSLAIEAPDDVQIIRGELATKKRADRVSIPAVEMQVA